MPVSGILIRCLLPVLLLSSREIRSAEPEKSVVQIVTFSQEPDWNRPWRRGSVQTGTGSGFLVQGRKILTNAHVVSWARQILVRRYQDPRPYPAHVAYIGHDCDLALLEIEDPRFFEGMEPLSIGDLPYVRSTVVTYGYPAGGEQISYTRGVVSRIEMQTYVHVGNRSFLTVQTDAAINPGNSGGPVIQEGRVVGVAFQGNPRLENTGFFIPPPVIRHFLEDTADGKYEGFPLAGIQVVPLQNPAQRQDLALPDDNLGALVDQLLPVPSTQKVLKAGDVLMEVAGYPVGSDGSVIYRGNRVSVSVVFHEAQSGDDLKLKIWRQGAGMEVTLPMMHYELDQAAGNQYDTLPRYLVYGGLVFTPLSLDYLKTFGRGWSTEAATELLYELSHRIREAPETVRAEPVVLAGVLTHSVNAHFRVQGRALVDQINGLRIERLEDVVRAFDRGGKNGQHLLEFGGKEGIEAMDAKEAAEAHPAILKTYGVLEDRRL